VAQRLFKAAWWNWDVERFCRHAGAITGADIDALGRAA
jgi:hypothetical protein